MATKKAAASKPAQAAKPKASADQKKEVWAMTLDAFKQMGKTPQSSGEFLQMANDIENWYTGKS